MSVEDLELCKKFIKEPSRNPRTGGKLLFGKGPYNSYVAKCSALGLLPVNTTQLSPEINDAKSKHKFIKCVFTGVDDTDLLILIKTNSLNDIVNIYNTCKYFRRLLNKPSIWNNIQKHFELFKLNKFLELALLEQELNKYNAKCNHSFYHSRYNYPSNSKRYYEYILNFKRGDRVVMEFKPENYLVLGILFPYLTLVQVDMCGQVISEELIVHKYNKKLRLWTNINHRKEGLKIEFGINDNSGVRIYDINSSELKKR
jgi:hypothetical protein